MIHSTKIKAIANTAIKDKAGDKRAIPPGLFKPHMTAMISGKTGSGTLYDDIRTLYRHTRATHIKASWGDTPTKPSWVENGLIKCHGGARSLATLKVSWG